MYSSRAWDAGHAAGAAAGAGRKSLAEAFALASPGFRSLPLGNIIYVAVAFPAWRERWAGDAPGSVGPDVLARGKLIAPDGEPITSALYWQLATAPSALPEALTDAVLETARTSLHQG